MTGLYNYFREYPHTVAQIVNIVVGILISFGVMQLGPEAAEEFSAQIAATILGIGAIVAARIGQKYTTPYPPLEE